MNGSRLITATPASPAILPRREQALALSAVAGKGLPVGGQPIHESAVRIGCGLNEQGGNAVWPAACARDDEVRHAAACLAALSPAARALAVTLNRSSACNSSSVTGVSAWSI